MKITHRMKKSNFRQLSTTALVLLASCAGNKDITEPEQIGKQVFGILKELGSENKADYAAHFMSLEEMHALADSEEIDEDERDRIKAMSQEEWTELIIGWGYNRITDRGKKYGIDWEEIVYADFTHELKEEDGIKGCKGTLSFEFREKLYTVRVVSIFDGTAYQLAIISSLRE